MSQQVVLFHSGLGLRPAVLDFAERLRAEGHTVHTPDLFDGEVFSSLEEGARKRDEVGIPGLVSRATESISGLPPGLVFAGFSMGAAAAEFLAATSPGAKAAILMHGALAPAGFGVEAWPRHVAVQVHYAEKDQLADPEGVGALSKQARGAGARIDVHTYPGGGHLFADDGLDEYDPEAAALMLRRVLGFLAEV
ncbi:MAG: dienelactone hydrolase family protein [Dehalococcoidia bacterium]